MSAEFSLYGWIIDHDHLTDHLEPEETWGNARGLMGPGHPQIPDEIIEKLQTGEGTKFRMLDDDGNAYYYGRLVDLNANDAFDNSFAPMDDFGNPNAGCVTIEYLTEHPERPGEKAWLEL